MRSVRECARRAVYVDDDGEIEVEVISALSFMFKRIKSIKSIKIFSKITQFFGT